MAPSLKFVFTLDVLLAPPLEFGRTIHGDRRFIPITGGRVEGPRLKAEILPGGGDWNAVRDDGVTHVFAKYSIRAEDGTLISITNEGYGRADQKTMAAVFGDDPKSGSMTNGGASWYTKTWPRFEVPDGRHSWLARSCFVGDLLPPTEPGRVKIDVYEIV